MYYVYIIRSINFSDKIYIGFTENLEERVARHNQGGSFHTAKYRPWKLETYTAFSNKEKALLFESYLKSGSGKAHCMKRLL